MATIALLDYRKPDLRKQTLENPVWLTSGIFGKEADDKGALLFSFPKVPVADNLNPYNAYAPAGDLGLCGLCYMIEDAVIEIVTGFVGGTVTLDIGQGTIATNAAVNGENITYSANDGIVDKDDITEATIGFYKSAVATMPRTMVVNADTSTPVIFAALASNAAITAGAARLHLKVSRVGPVK
jgi:hypothetical protein